MNNRSIEQCIKNRYSRKNFVSLAREMIPFEIGEPVPLETSATEKEKLEAFNYLGETKIDNKDMHLLEVKLKDTSLEHSPTFQRNLVAKYLKLKSLDAAIVSFYSDEEPLWKLSLVTVRYKLEDGKPTEELSEAKRFSFIVGMGQPVHTATVQLEKLAGKQNSYQEILDAFSIEKVTKDFFVQVASAFRMLVGGKEKINNRTEDFGDGVLQLPIEDKKVWQEFAIRLINRLIFCWFLKKKKTDTGRTLISNKLLSSKSVEGYKNEILLQFIADSYYQDIIEPLFFEIMNKPQDTRLAKYAKVKEFNNIPFLNGGLFEPNKLSDFYELDKTTGIAKNFNIVKVPDEWFKHFFEILETYNFTVDENTPVEIELSIDPEMLGRIFENLLAEINPETGQTARKSTGSYYTPRTIVEFMVNESLKYYLADKTKIGTDNIENLLSYSSEEANLSEEEKNKILNALDSLKILDPACGSGAFPMGALQKILLILQKVDPKNKKWFEKFIDKIPDSLLKEETRKKFEGEDLDYLRKLAILQHSIYGVDVQPMATEISRLRAFLSLIVDAKVDSTKRNMGIEPLPNLDFKFVTANSLIDIEKVIQQKNSQLIKDSFFEEFEKLTQKYFVASVAKEKNSIRKHIEELIDKKVNEKVEHIEQLGKVLDSRFGISKEKKEKIAKLNYEADLWRSYKNIFKGEPVKFFNPKYFFPDVRNGFDIVIANPPYITFKGKQKVKVNEKDFEVYKKLYINSAEYKINSFALFIEKGTELLSSNGILSYITPSSLLQNQYLAKIRRHLLTNYYIYGIIIFTNRVFTAITDSIILFVANKNSKNLRTFIVRKQDADFSYFKKTYWKQSSWETDNSYVINLKINEADSRIIDKIKTNSQQLSSYFNIYVGIVANGIKKFLSTTKLDSNYKKYLRGRNIYRYKIVPTKLYINFDINNLHSNTNERVYLQKEKILVRKTGKFLLAAYDDKQFYTDQSIYNLYPKKNCVLKLKYILALINSKLINFYFLHRMITNPDVYPYVKGIHLKMIPVKSKPLSEQQPFIDLVNQILSITSKETYNPKADTADNKKVKALEHQIDQLVYELYNLTPEEIKIVEGADKIQK